MIILLIFSNEFLEVIEENNKVFVRNIKIGFPLKEFSTIISNYPRLKLTNFALLKSILSKVTPNPVEIGKWLPPIEVEVTKDKMSAFIYINESKEIIHNKKNEIEQQINNLLTEQKIIHGVLSIDLSKVETGKAVLVAEGTKPIKGEDAKVSYLEVPERKPVILEDGRADFYNLNFLFEIKEGSWLGEKIKAKHGIPGKNIYGDLVEAAPGKDIPLKYDRKTAIEVDEGDKIILKAKHSGVLEHRQGVVTVNRHLVIDGDVGVETGNIDFDGSVSIRGTVQNGYSVVATGDVLIEHPDGVSGAKLIQSTEGEILIRGGIFGLGKSIVQAKKSIMVKHVNEANLIAGEEIMIASYTLGSNLSANKITVDERIGKIIGGKAVAQDTIITAYSGNHLERRTELIIENVSKQETQVTIQEKAKLLKQLHDEIVHISSRLNNMILNKVQMKDNQLLALEQAGKLVEQKKQEAEQMDMEIKTLMNQFHKQAKEQIVVRKEAYPGTLIQIGRKSTLLSKQTNGVFRIENGELNV